MIIFTVNIRNLRLFLLAITITLASGCATLKSARINRFVTKNNFRAALAALNEEGAGDQPGASISPKLLEARDRYEQAVVKHFLKLYHEQLELGKLRSAAAILDDGLSLCSWSTELKSRHQETQSLVTLTDSLLESWKHHASEISQLPDQARRFLTEVGEVKKLLEDTPELKRLFRQAEGALVQSATRLVTNYKWGEGPEEIEDAADEIGRLTVSDSLPKEFVGAINAIPRLASAPELVGKRIVPTKKFLDHYLAATDLRNTRSKPYEAALGAAVASKMEDWMRAMVFPALDRSGVDYELLEFSSQMVQVLKGELRKEMNVHLAQGYVQRSRLWAGMGVESILTLAYLNRAYALGFDDELARTQITTSALTALRNALPIHDVLDLSVAPEVDPMVTPLVYWWAYTFLAGKTKEWHEWELLEEREDNRLSLEVKKADLILDGRETLKVVGSTYLSHYQDVRNPRKDYLKRRLGSAKLQADFAESSYSSAVSSHNIYPTSYSLQNVNYARNRYVSAVDAYNSLVNQYNATPSLVSEPVYLPYTFQEGTLRFGWSLMTVATVNGEAESSAKSSIDTDWVRMGTKYTDTHVNRRRDDPVQLDLSDEALYRHLDTAFKAVLGGLNVQLLGFRYSSNTELHPDEVAMLSWLLHPWGAQSSLLRPSGAPTWLEPVDLDSILAEHNPKPSAIVLKEPASSPNTFSVERFSESVSGYVCQIIGKSKLGDVSSGSGVLVSGDGLILTCAHVIAGRTGEALFHAGENKGSHEIDVVMVNAKRDVAILRAKGVHAQSWAAVRLERDVRRGEDILAVGNPSLPDGSINVLGVSKGIVSNPETEIFHAPYLVADINIASGSSGGPVFSLKDGKVIGIVLAVADAKIASEGVSSSGFSCLAAPAAHLTEWLGLENE